MRIAVGTTSELKLQYLQEVLDELKINIEILPTDVESGISEQPLSSEETKEGSVNRAKNAFENYKDADLALGMEVGYHPNKDGKYEMFCYATLINKNGKQQTAESHRLLLPDFHQGILKENKYLGDHVRRYIEDSPDEYSKEVGEDIRNRKTFIKAAIKSVLKEHFT